MRPTRLLAALAAVVLLTGCATVDKDSQTDDGSAFLAEVTKFTVADLTLAYELAMSAAEMGDEGAWYRARCWETLLEWVPATGPVPSSPEPMGTASAFEIRAERAAGQTPRGRIPERVKADCAYVRQEFRRLAPDDALKVAPVPGGNAVDTILK